MLKRWFAVLTLLLMLTAPADPWPVHGKYVQPSGAQLITSGGDPLTTLSGDRLVTQ